jgi:hypothetical protein
MRYRLRTLLIVVGLAPPLLWAYLGLIAELRLAVMRAKCANGVKERTDPRRLWLRPLCGNDAGACD